MGKKYTTDEIHIGGHELDAAMMVNLNTVASNHTTYLTSLPSHTHDIISVNSTNSIDVQDHGGNTWLRNSSGQWVFQAGSTGDDWTQSFTHYLPPAGSTSNAVYVEIGQRTSNASDGRYKGIKIVKYESSGVSYGDIEADKSYFSAYYDRDNTAYFLNPTNTSNVNIVRTKGLGVNTIGNQTNKNGLSLYGAYGGGEPTYGIMFSGTAGSGTHGAVTSDWATYFTMNSASSRGWIFRRVGSGNSASISAVGAATFDTSVTSPVFYDSNNTGYFLNPAGTSLLNGLEVDGDIDMRAQVGTWITSDVMSDAIGWNTNYGVYIGSDIGGTHYLRGNGTFTTGGSTYNLWHAGNDGSGSGLDADLLDGIDSSGFVKQLSDASSPDYTTPSSRRVNPNTSNPTNHHYAVTTFGNDGNVTGQLATHYVTGLPYTRGFNSVWSTWKKIWTDANDGSGSGLDADLLDGQHSSAFQAAGSYVTTNTTQSISGAKTFSSSSNHYNGHLFYDAYDANGNHYPHFHDGSNANGVNINWRLYSGSSLITHTWNYTDTNFVNSLRSTVDMRAPSFYDSDNTAYYLNPASTSNLNTLNAATINRNPVVTLSGDVTGSATMTNLGSINITTAVANDSHTHDGRYYTETESDSRFVNVTGDTMSGSLDVNADIQANTFTQAAHGIPRNNLGAPTVTEMALFDNQFTPKTTLANDYDDLTDLTFWVQTTSSSAWTEITTFSDDQKRKFLRTNNSNIAIPNGAYKFRVEFVGKGYTFANAMYAYWSSNSHNTQVHVWKYNVNSSSWIQHTSSSATVSSWPGHLYLPFSTIPWLESATTHTGHYKSLRIEFTPTWSTGTYSDRVINLYGMQVWGGYPSGRRTPHYYDQNGRLNVTKELSVSDNIRTPTFYDSNNTGYYLNPAETSNLANLIVGGNTTLGNSNGDTTKINDILELYATDSGDSHFYFGEDSSGGYGTYWNWDSGHRHTWYSRHAGSNSSIMYHNTNDTSYLHMGRSINMNNSAIDYVTQLHFNDNVRFYDEGNDSYLNFKYGDATTGGIIFRNGGGSVKGYVYATGNSFGLLDNDGHWAVRTQTGTDPLTLYCDNNPEFHVYNSYTYSPGSSRAPIFYDSNDTNYYVNPASTSNLNGLTVNGTLTASLPYSSLTGAPTIPTDHGDHDGLYLPIGGKAADSELLDGINSTSFLRSDAHDSFSGTLTGSAQIMIEPNDFGKGVYGKYNSSKFQHVWGMGASWHLDPSGADLGNFYGIAYTHSNAGTGSQSGFSHQTLFVENGVTRTWIGRGVRTVGDLMSDISVKAPIFYDSDNTAYYLNPASTSNLNAVTWSGGSSANANTAYTHSQAAHAPTNAEANVQSDWNATSGDALILNKPTIPTNNNQLTNGAGYTTYSANQNVNTTDSPTFSNLYVADHIFHTGDTNTYMQFHAADQWRVVTGGVERLEVNNSQVTVANSLQVNGSIYTSQYIYHTGDVDTYMRFPSNDTISWNTAGSERMRINSSGNVGIGTTAPANKLHVTGTIYGNGGIIGSSDLWLRDQSSAYSTELKMQNNTHTIGIDYQNNETLRFITRSGTTTVPITFQMRAGTITAANFILSSDERKKTKIVDLTCDNVDVSWKSFEMKDNEGEYRTGVIAQELEQKHPEFVNTDDEGYKTVKYIDLLIAKIAELEARLEKLEK